MLQNREQCNMQQLGDPVPTLPPNVTCNDLVTHPCCLASMEKDAPNGIAVKASSTQQGWFEMLINLTSLHDNRMRSVLQKG